MIITSIVGIVISALAYILFQKIREIRQLKQELITLRDEIESKRASVSSIGIKLKAVELELKSYKDIEQKIKDDQSKHEQVMKDNQEKYAELRKEREAINEEIYLNTEKLNTLKEEIDELKPYINLQESGLIRSQYKFESLWDCEEALNIVRFRQKELIKNSVLTDNEELMNTQVFKSIKKVATRAFCAEAHIIIDNVKFSNGQRSLVEINKVFSDINKSMQFLSCRLNEELRDSKLKELKIVFERAEKIEAIKEEQKALREMMREEEEARREAEAALRDAENEESKYKDELEQIQNDFESTSSDEEKLKLKNIIEELKQKLLEAVEKKERAKSMAEITKEGHIYIISNIGSFGKDVYKVGMTRRLNPDDRVKELSNASVPFKFDIHAMIKTNNAPSLEKKLHEKLENFRINKVNSRKEFFKVSIDKIKNIVEDLDGEFKFSKLAFSEAEASEYYQTVTLEAQDDQ